jgi:glutaredoxin 3
MADVLIYTSAMCPYCVAAKNLLVKKGAAYTEIRVDLDRGKREEMMARAKRTSVPQIFIGEIHIGGFDDMVALDRKGGLEPLLGGAA